MAQQASRKPVFPPEIAPFIDVGAYLLDSRAPAATLYLDKLLEGKELILLTRAEQSDARSTRQWHRYFIDAGYRCLVVDSVSGQGMEAVLDFLANLLKRKMAVARSRGIKHATLRMVALGVPNVGKSTFLNKLIGRRRLKTGDKPGITRGRQWVRLFEDVEVLDTAGVLRDPEALNRRKPYWMLLNLMPYDASIREECVQLLLDTLDNHGWRKLVKYYRFPSGHTMPEDWLALLENVALRRGFSVQSEDDVDRAARRLIKDFQLGRFGRITLEEAGIAQITSPLFKPAKAAAPEDDFPA